MEYVSCSECKDSFSVSEKEKDWRKMCSECFKKTRTQCTNCDERVKIFTVKKDGPNNGKRFYNCKACSVFEWVN